MEDLHRELARIGFDAGADLGLVLAGGYAISAHQLTTRPSRDIDFATAAMMPLPQVVGRLAEAYRRRGYLVQIIESGARMARMMVTGGEHACEVDLLREPIGPPVLLDVGPVLLLDDAVGLKMRALHDRALHRDFIDVYAAYRAGYSWQRMEILGSRFLPAFRLDDLAERLSSIELRDEETFLAYGMAPTDIEALAGWALRWADDIGVRLEGSPEPSPGSEPDWDTYLEE
ncbi:nucleotidyl transferase AbiEii/AbiGii toxin family protein [Krasilnikovia sp. MM14-A1004]|uniref:nucleotidyl transferase AbiEii/AbiGii toxin family protein n=1 Tax=Krasilnikovia sp. MM14-A1004 TaxID=3373541 RepID=UPI00399CA45B